MISPRIREVLKIGRDLGLDFYDLVFEVIPWDVMNEIAAYGLPIRAHHWSYGRVYQRQRIHGRMGLSKIYEIVLNNDPAYAFLLDSNTEVENLLIVAHVAAHADFFKNNACFEGTNRNMVNEAAAHAVRIEQYKEEYGIERVERLMDAAFALERHVDPYKGLYREEYPKRTVEVREAVVDEYADLTVEGRPFSQVKQVKGGKIPAHPERDLLWFLARYAPLDEWERDVLEIVREEAYYFFPQFNSKILNEGWASYWHAEIISQYPGMTPREMIDFSVLHGNVVQPGHPLQVNPYYLGYKILVDVKKRWDRMHARGESRLDGTEKLFEIRTSEDDFSFLRNYLTPELVKELGLFAHGPACSCPPHTPRPCPRCGDVAIRSRDVDAVVEAILKPRYNYGAPKVVVTDTAGGVLRLEHDEPGTVLDREYAEKTLAYIHELWKAPVQLITANERGEGMEYWCDEKGARVTLRAGTGARRG
ncbi:MAG: SpoVR family protein [Clostridia bacterium]